MEAQPVQTLDELDAACGEDLAWRLEELCRWDPQDCGQTWVASDQSYMIVSFRGLPTAHPFVQFLSAPEHSTVLCEVVSTQYQPDLAGLLTKERTEALLARGFSFRANPSNFRREVVIDGPEAARRVAAEALEILFHTFQYRGAHPLDCEVVHERVASARLAHTQLTAPQLAFVLRSLGFEVLAVERQPGKTHGVRARSRSMTFEATLNGPVGKSSYRDQLVLTFHLARAAKEPLEAANIFNGTFSPARAIVRDESLRLDLVVPLAMGITEEYLRSALMAFSGNMQELGLTVSMLKADVSDRRPS